MANRTAGSKKRKRRRMKPPRAGPVFQADRKAARDRREALNFTGPKRRRWKKTMRKTKDAELRRRYQMVWLWCEGFQQTAIAQMLFCHRNSVRNVLNTFEEKGELGLVDGRVSNGSTKASEAFVQQVEKLIASSPPKKWNHTTWTEELLTIVMAERTGVAVSIATICVWIASYTGAQFFPILNNFFENRGLPGAVYWVFSVICVFSLLFGIKLLPETKGRTLEEIAASWKKR